MDMHRALKDRVWRLGVHHIEHAVNGLIAADAKNGTSQDLLVLRVYDDPHEPLGFALFHRSRYACHGALSDKRAPAGFAHLTFRHSNAAQGRVNIKVVGGDAVADAPRVMVKEVGGDDFKVVIGRVSESAFAVAIAQGPYPGYAGLQLVVHTDVTVRVPLDTSSFQTKVIRVGHPTHSQQDVASNNLRVPLFTFGEHGDSLWMRP